jgi:hypothetical protein
MNRDRLKAREQMRQDLYAAIRRNLIRRETALSRHEIIQILANVLIGQIELIRDDARTQSTQ